jgi:hypothetical protein
VKAAAAYVEVSPIFNDTIVYVGEGCGGANADDAFFFLVESGDWILVQVLPVKSFSETGFETLYVLKRVVGGINSSYIKAINARQKGPCQYEQVRSSTVRW